jgi:AcrR family transcriptional regulator
MTDANLAISPRARRTRDALLEAGLKLFAKRPIDAVPIDDIVASAGVAKGSFFNHFTDKQMFAGELANEVRRDLEARVAEVNDDIKCPLERLTNGMLVAVNFALTEHDRTVVMLRGALSSTARDHPLNQGLLEDIEAAIASSKIPESSRTAGLLFWLGNCQMLMMNIVERRPERPDAAARMYDIMSMALTGLGVQKETSSSLADICRNRLIASGVSPT